MMVCVVSTFFVSWAPLYLVHGYILFYGYPENNEQVYSNSIQQRKHMLRHT